MSGPPGDDVGMISRHDCGRSSNAPFPIAGALAMSLRSWGNAIPIMVCDCSDVTGLEAGTKIRVTTGNEKCLASGFSAKVNPLNLERNLI
ncbi:hypothetical protein ACLOJK_013547 [Asimina triloba]